MWQEDSRRGVSVWTFTVPEVTRVPPELPDSGRLLLTHDGTGKWVIEKALLPSDLQETRLRSPPHFRIPGLWFCSPT